MVVWVQRNDSVVVWVQMNDSAVVVVYYSINYKLQSSLTFSTE